MAPKVKEPITQIFDTQPPRDSKTGKEETKIESKK